MVSVAHPPEQPPAMSEAAYIDERLDTGAANREIGSMITTSKACDLFLGDLERRNYSKRTIDTYRRILWKFCDRLPNDLDVARITTDDCRRFLDYWNKSAAGTRAHAFSVLSSFFKWLFHTERIKRSPMDRLERPRRLAAEDLDVKTLSADDVRALLAAAGTGCTSDQNPWTERLAIGIAAYMGARRRAIALLRLRDYDRAKQEIRFFEKGGKTIWKPVPTELAILLDQAIAAGQYADENSYLVPEEARLYKVGDRDDRVIWSVVKRVADRAKVDAHVHSLRAAFAVFFLEQHPGDIEALKELLGHRSLTTTQVYLRKLNRGSAMERVRDLDWGEKASS